MGNAQARPAPSAARERQHSDSELRQVTHNNHDERQTVGNDDPSEAIKHAYESLVTQDMNVKEDLMKTFKELRILVVGKTGSGKSTLIRMIVGDSGPRNIQHGVVGKQDIRREWRHPDLPFIIHDSNGIDTSGERRMEDIQRFMGKRLAYEKAANEFQQRVHAVWYVFSALENRVKEDHGLLQMLDSYGKELPLLLIVTHHRSAMRASGMEEVDLVIEEVLEAISDEERRSRLRETMVRVENKVKFDGTGDVVEETEVDKKALEEVVERTQSLMDEELWVTWAACQAVNVRMKMEASVSVILEERHHQQWTSIFRMASMFASFTQSLAKIWSASHTNLGTAIVSSKCFQDEQKQMSSVTSHLWQNPFPLAAAAAGIAVTAALPIVADAAVVVWILRSGGGVMSAGGVLTTVLPGPARTSKLIVSYGLLLLGAIMYVHVRDVSSLLQQRSVDHYSQLFEEFLQSECAKEISNISDRYTSMSYSAQKRDHLKQRLLSDICDFFDKLQQQPQSITSSVVAHPRN